MRNSIRPDCSFCQMDSPDGYVALDCTRRGQAYGGLDRLKRIRSELRTPVAADVATEEEAIAAARAGANMVMTTMRGYTEETAHLPRFDADFVASLVGCIEVPVIAEGRIQTPEEALSAIDAGAFAVIVGTAITRPAFITSRFADALRSATPRRSSAHVLGVDLGATNTKCGIVSERGQLFDELAVPTPRGGRHVLLRHLKAVVKGELARARAREVSVSAIGIATAGWVDIRTGSIAYATENLPGWTGTPVRDELESKFGLPVWVENDANVLAHAEKYFGSAKDCDDFVCITLGTGVGGGCYANGQLIRGANSFANAIGHMMIRSGGPSCSCGQSGCLEVYANADALVREADDKSLTNAQEVIAAANAGIPAARHAIRVCASALADGCASIVHLLDPSRIILSGGLAQNNPLLVSYFEDCLRGRVMTSARRSLEVKVSSLGYYSGVLGAGALALHASDVFENSINRKLVPPFRGSRLV